MTNSEKIKYFVEKQMKEKAEALLFSLNTKELKEIHPTVKELCVELLTYQQLSKNTYGTKSKGNQSDILNLAGILCLTKKDFKKYCNSWHYRSNYEGAKKIFATGQAKWLMTDLGKDNRFSYLELMDAQESAFFDVNNEQLAEELTNTIRYYYYKEPLKYLPENLEKYAQTLKEHIWFLFEYETTINHTDDQRYQSKTFDEPIWKFTFKNLIKDKKIDRIKVLKECLLTSNRNFNKVLSGWFYDLFLYLEPTEKELIELQAEMFNALGSQHSRIVNGVLKTFKTLSLNKAFLTNDFLDNSDILLSSETKSIATSTLMIFDKIVKSDKDRKTQLVEKSVMAFNSTFKDVQLRASKFIAKHGDIADENLKDELSVYAQDLFSESKTVLAEYLSQDLEETLDENLAYDAIKVIREDNIIQEIETVDDFIFLASQAFDNNEPYHFEQLIQGLIDFQDELKEEGNGEKLEPAFQRAYKLLFNGSTRQTGVLDHLLATFFINFGKNILFDNETTAAKLFKKTYLKYDKEDTERDKQSKWYKKVLVSLKNWKFREHHESIYHIPFLNRLLYIEKLFKSKQKVQLISIPTHAPFWIAPITLVERIAKAQNAGQTINEQDLCVGIARCSMVEEDLTEALVFVEKNITGELKVILNYLLNPKAAIPKVKILIEPLHQAILNKKEQFSEIKSTKDLKIYNKALFMGEIDYKVDFENYKSKEWDHKLKKNKIVDRVRKNFDLILNEEKEATLIDKLKRKHKPQNLTHAQIAFGKYLYDNENSDLKRVVGVVPNNSEIIFSRVTKHCFAHDWWESNEERVATNLFETILEIPQKPLKSAHLMMVCALFAKPKSVKSYAAEYWTQLVSKDQLDIKLLGEMIGNIQKIEFYPLKRFTDLILEQMINISLKHNAAIQYMIESAIPFMDDKPIKNTKKLLEILVELRLKSNASVLDEKIIAKLNSWLSSASLKKVIKQLI